MKSHAWIKKGTTYCTSRYATLSADSHTPTLSEATIADSITKGNSTAVTGGTKPNMAMITNRSADPIRKSGTHANAVPAGITTLGKYTFDTRFWLPTRLLPEAAVALANIVQGTRATNAKTG